MISLLLFALIAVAGVALVDSVLGVQGKTEARLDRLTALQRAMLVVTGDLEQVARRRHDRGRGRGQLLARRRRASAVRRSCVRYALDRGVLVRDAGSGAQAVLRGVTACAGGSGRTAGSIAGRRASARDWPQRGRGRGGARRAEPAGTLRRVVTLPVRAKAVT